MSDTTITISPEDAAWLRANAIPLAGTRPGSGDADLHPLGRLIGDARVVALGEASHGTHEFFALRHRLTAYLVRELGFTHVAVEANWAEAELVNEWVGGGNGDLERLLVCLSYWSWNTREMLDFLHWMQVFNRSTRGVKLSFSGFDMQAPRMAIENVLAYFRKVDSYFYADLLALDLGLRTGEQTSTTRTPGDRREQWAEAIARLLSRRCLYEASSSTSEFLHALHSAQIALQGELMIASAPATQAAAMRDTCMAANFLWLYNHASTSSKFIIWAHNEHIGHLSYGPIGRPIRSMGSRLHKHFGKSMITCGLIGYTGACNALSLSSPKLPQAYPIHLPPSCSYEEILHQALGQRADLRIALLATGCFDRTGIGHPRLLRSIGATYEPTQANSYFHYVDIQKKYDLILYVQDTSPSELL